MNNTIELSRHCINQNFTFEVKMDNNILFIVIIYNTNYLFKYK